MMKRLFCILLSLMMLTAASFALAEDAAVETAAEETAVVEPAAEETSEPVLLVTVNGEEIWSNSDYLQMILSYYLDVAESNGYDITDQGMLDTINWYSLQYTMRTTVLRQKAAELGLDQLTDEEKAEMEAGGKEQWAALIDYYISSTGAITDTATDDEKAAARADAEAELLKYGYTEEMMISQYTEEASEQLLTDRLKAYLTADKTVTDEEVQAYFDDLVKDDKESYENDVGSYEFYSRYYGQPSYYTPEGYRGVTHILLKVDDELLNTWKDLSARLEEQKSDAQAETVAPAETAADAEPTAEPEPTEEPVTEEMVKAAEQAILDSVRPTVDEIKAKLAGGTSFDDLIKEYGQDPGMEDDATRAEGYAVHKDSILWDPAFTEAAMALQKIGDVGEPIVGQYGVHILHYLRDIPGGAVELTDEMKEEFRSTMLSEIQNEALNSALDQWMEEGNIVYTEAGEDWKLTDPAPAASEEAPAEETDAAAEETANP